MLFSLLLLCYDGPFKIQVVFFVQNLVKCWVCPAINPDFLEFSSEMIFDRLLFEGVSF